jgi:hypothetical protein
MVIAICVSLIMLYGACITGSAIKFGLGEEELPATAPASVESAAPAGLVFQ